MEKFPTWLVVMVGLILLVNVGFLAFGGKNVDLSGIESKLTAIGSATSANTAAINDLKSIPTVTPAGPGNVTSASPGQFSLTKEEFEDQAIEDEALRLATEDVNSRDFKKKALVALEDFNNWTVNDTQIESYKDITLKILDVDVDGDEVTFDIKLLYFLDGDEDETEAARLDEFVVTVDDLDFDDKFVDAEVDESYLEGLEVIRVYD